MFVTFIIIIIMWLIPFCQIIKILLYFHPYRDNRAYILDPCIREFLIETFIGSKMFLTFFNVKYDSAYLTTEIWDWFDILSVLEKKSINAGRRLLKYFFIKMCFSVSKMMTFWFHFYVLIVVHFAKSFFWPSIWHAMIWKDLKEKLRKRLLCSKNRPIELLAKDGTFAVHSHTSQYKHMPIACKAAIFEFW